MAQTAVRVGGADHVHVVLHRGGQVVALPQAGDAVPELGDLGGVAFGQWIEPGAGMGVDEPVGLVLLVQVVQQLNQHDVLEHIGVVAGVKGVAVTQHGRTLCSEAGSVVDRVMIRAFGSRIAAVDFDVIVIGAGAAGMMCAAQAGQRGRRVLLLEHARKLAEKIRISGGGRCNFTNLHCRPEAFLSHNPHFCRSALARYTPRAFHRAGRAPPYPLPREDPRSTVLRRQRQADHRPAQAGMRARPGALGDAGQRRAHRLLR